MRYITRITTFLKSRVSYLILIVGILFTGACSGQSVNTNSGKDFWFGYTQTFDGTLASYVVYINTFSTTNGTVSIPGSAWSANFTAVAGVTTRIVLPSVDVVVTSFNSAVNQAVNVVADSNISVYAAIEYTLRTDNTCIMPVPLLGNQYYVLDDTLLSGTYPESSNFMIIDQGCIDSVEIIPSRNSSIGPAHVPFITVLQSGQVFEVVSDSDLTGSMVVSLNHSETGVIAGTSFDASSCHGTGNPYFEEIIPSTIWGENYVFLPTPQAQDQCRVLAEQNGTIVTFQTNSGNNIQILNAGQHYDTTVNYSSPVYINSSNPVSVGRFMRTATCNEYYITNPTNKGDPAQAMVEANEQMFLDSVVFYVSLTPDFDSMYVEIVTRTVDIGTVFLDNINIGAFFTTLVPNPVYSYCSLPVLQGSHTLTSTGQGFLAYTTGLGHLEGETTAAGVYLKELNISSITTTPSTCSANNGTATATVSTGIPPFIYSWSNGETTQTATGLSAGTYTVTVTDMDCVPHKATDTAIIRGTVGYTALVSDTNPNCANSLGSSTVYPSGGTAPYTYNWSNGETTQTATGLGAGSYTCTITDSTGCVCTATAHLVNSSSLTLVISPSSDTICSGNSVPISVSGGTTYSWTPSNGLSCTTCSNPIASPTTTTTYIVTGSDTNGCSNTGSVRITVSTVPVLANIPSQTICSGDPAILIASEIAGGGGTYTWEPGGSTGTILTVYPDSTTAYTVTCTNKCGSSSSIVTVFVAPGPTPLFGADITQGCAPLCIQFRDMSTISSGNITQWLWSFGNGDSSHLKSPIYCYPENGSFTIRETVISGNGCSSSLEKVQMITVYSKPHANFSYSPQPINVLEPTVQFTDKSTDAYGIVYWIWNFGDGGAINSDNSLQNPTHTYPDTGTYCPQLIVENNQGCIDTTTQCLVVEPIFTLYIPSAFSPNGDGLNDIFIPKGDYIKSFEMYIFDRWGTELYHTTNITEGWNGTSKGSSTVCQEDSYVYKITVTDWHDTEHSYIGQVSLIK